MFRLHRHRSEKSGERIDFKFSNFQALQVPKGWDKLFVSMISVETGKTIAKSSKASVRNGNCKWTETMSESIWVPKDEASKELEEYLFKLVVAMGSARSGILGEATINLTGYMSSRASVPVSLPLKKCNHGTILQVKLQCLTPRLREEEWKESNSNLNDLNADYDDMDNKSEESDNIFTRSVGSSSSNHLGSTSHPGELGSREPSFSASGSHRSSDSAEGSIGRASFSPINNSNGDTNNFILRQDSSGSQNSPHYGIFPVDDPSRSNHSSFNSKITGSGSHHQGQRQDIEQRSSHMLASSPLRNVGSSKDLMEAAEDTIEELRIEARMWERNARKLMLDMEIVKKELSDQSRHQADLNMELSAAQSERDSLRKEIRHLKILLEESMEKQTVSGNAKFDVAAITHFQKEMEDEIKFQQETNSNLSLQLKKTQESNMELISVLQEMEETIEKQRLEIDNLAVLKNKSGYMENYNHGNEDNGELSSAMEASFEKIRKFSADSELEGFDVENTKRNSHEQLETGDMGNLKLQLQELQESKNNLQATIQLLEKSLENKNQEIELEQNLKNQALYDMEVRWASRLSAKEEEIITLKAKFADSPSSDILLEMASNDGGDPNLIKEIKALKIKVQELEGDCNELTDENLELIFKLKELEKDSFKGGTSICSSSNKLQENLSPSMSESEVFELKSQIYYLEQELKKKEMLAEGVSTDLLEVQLIDLQNKCTSLEFQLQTFKDDKESDIDARLHESRIEAEEREMEIAALKRQLKSYPGKETDRDNKLTVSNATLKSSEPLGDTEISKIFPELYQQLQIALDHVKKPWYNICSPVNSEWDTDNFGNLNITDATTQNEQAGAILTNLVTLNKSLEAKITECEDGFQRIEAQIRERDANVLETQQKLEDYSSKEKTLYSSIQELENLKMELEANVADLTKELMEKRSEIEVLQVGSLLKEEEIEALRSSQRDLESQVSNLEKEKYQLEENVEIVSRESSITSKCLDDVQNDVTVLTRRLESNLSANKMLERKSSEQERAKHELELHLSELEEENVQLSERISGLEAQLRYLTNEKETSRLEQENSKSLVMNLREEIRKMGVDMETQKVDLKERLHDMQKRWEEAQEECEYLKKANPKLQATTESLMEECSSLQKLNGELRKQKLELHEQCTHLEAELRETREGFSHCLKKVEILGARLSSMEEDIASKEKYLTSELDALLLENKEQKEKLVMGESLLNQMYLEKTVEVENLQREVAHLTEQISSTHDERERIASDAVLEVSRLRADKAKMENSLQEFQNKVKLSENELDTLRIESGVKIEALVIEISASKQNHELLMADHEKLLSLLEDVKSNEEKFKSTVNGLELKLTASGFEMKQLVEEIASLKVQLRKIPNLQDEVLALKVSLNETKFEKEKLETSLQLLSRDSEELKAERISLLEKIFGMQEAVSELEDCRNTRVSLEEKLMRLEGDLTAREALCAQDAELKNELSRVKRANSQFQRKIQYLEEEKSECVKRAQALEEELKLKKEQVPSESITEEFPGSAHENLKLSKNEVEIDQLSELSNGQPYLDPQRYQIEGGNKPHHHDGTRDVRDSYPASRIRMLENELAEALEANNMYKVQLKRFLSEDHNGHVEDPTRLAIQSEVIKKEGSERNPSLLEAELREIRERYFDMSLRYAEVEAEREELVMKLKAIKSGKRFPVSFSFS